MPSGGAVDLYLCCTGCCLFIGPPLAQLVDRWGNPTPSRPRFLLVATDREEGEARHRPAGFPG